MLAGLGLAGASALSACARDAGPPDADALADCHRSLQRASLAVQVAGPEMAPGERQAARRQLSDASARVLHVWAKREGLDISAAQFSGESAKAEAFLEGINAEAGLSEQQRAAALSSAGDAPEQWQNSIAIALDCAEKVAP